MDLVLEITAVILGFAYLYFIIKENKICWFFGIASSLVSIWLFYRSTLYAESILYVYYVIIGVYGYVLWNKSPEEQLKVTDVKASSHLLIISVGILLSYALGYVFSNYTDAKSPFLDSTTTIFSFIASYLEAKKKLSGWIYWVVINLSTIFLYHNRSLDYYAGLTVVYTVFSVVGYIQWKKHLNKENKPYNIVH
ncbi:nicotinamide riboside transporter PnuC [Saccharicrinis aurantiacus]|uniref:nicotinamide riboside transporter PnuC n=1 Tax=Saccharicrinis aurantiacus TaxID=1849719 RepID=UPI00248F8CB1|nr:nicotinamide riboside transporter PnuC [Saccharicrinis aurantiacus]